MKNKKIFYQLSFLVLSATLLLGFQVPQTLEVSSDTGIELNYNHQLCWLPVALFLESVESKEEKYISYMKREFILNEEGAEDLRELSIAFDENPSIRFTITHISNERDRVRAISIKTVLESFGVHNEHIQIKETDQYKHVSKNVFLVQLIKPQEYVMD